MTTNAVAAGMTPYRPSPPPSPFRPTGAFSARWGGSDRATPDDAGSSLTWPEARRGPGPVIGTPSCAEELGSWFGAVPSSPAALPLPAAGGDEPVAEPGFLAERQPGGWTCVREAWTAAAGIADVLDRYLGPTERAVYDGLRPAVRPTWLLGRVAAKDAVRWWLADRGTEVEPADVPLANEPSGRPYIDARASRADVVWPAIDLRISIAHVSGTGVALVSQGHDVGIDVEEAAPRPASFARVAFSRTERFERLSRTSDEVVLSCAGTPTDPHATMDEATWMAAAWTAKEAAGKADGTGLQGRPTRFVTKLVGPDLFTVGERLVRCHRLDPVRHCSHAGHSLVVGWTLSVDRTVTLDAEPGVALLGAGAGA